MSKSLPSSLLIIVAKFIWTTLWRIMMSQLAPSNESGEYNRPLSQFRHKISTEQDNQYIPEERRYRLYVGLSCPWACDSLSSKL
jgi:putative glutathione S-transferase